MRQNEPKNAVQTSVSHVGDRVNWVLLLIEVSVDTSFLKRGGLVVLLYNLRHGGTLSSIANINDRNPSGHVLDDRAIAVVDIKKVNDWHSSYPPADAVLTSVKSSSE